MFPTIHFRIIYSAHIQLPPDHSKQTSVSEAINLPPGCDSRPPPYQVGSWRYKRRWPLPRNSSIRADRGGWAGRRAQSLYSPPTPSDIGHTCLEPSLSASDVQHWGHQEKNQNSALYASRTTEKSNPLKNNLDFCCPSDPNC